MNKIVVFALLLAIVGAGVAFAADGYTVQNVTGKVEREVSPGKWEAVKAGAVLPAGTVVNTGLNSTLVVQNNGKDVTIRAMQKGAIDALAGAGSGGAVKIGGNVLQSNTRITGKGASNISTASTRASEAQDDYDWAE